MIMTHSPLALLLRVETMPEGSPCVLPVSDKGARQAIEVLSISRENKLIPLRSIEYPAEVSSGGRKELVYIIFTNQHRSK